MTREDRIVGLRRPEAALSGLPESRLIIAAALACGFRPSGDKWHMDAISTPIDSAPDRAFEPHRWCSWAIDETSRAVFVTADGREEITFATFVERFESDAWCKAHPTHPIAYQRETLESLKNLSAQIKGYKPLLHFTRGRREMFLPQRGDPRFDEAKDAEFRRLFEEGLDA